MADLEALLSRGYFPKDARLSQGRTAKANKSGALLGNTLDKLVRAAQDGQTIGIPIGPDTSLIVSELVMCAADQTLSESLPATGFRYVDDIELSFVTRAEAESALGSQIFRLELQSCQGPSEQDGLQLRCCATSGD